VVPDREACLALLDEAGVDEGVRARVLAVERLAAALADLAREVDRETVTAGALLHDVGRAFDNGPDHVPEGLAFLEERGVPRAVLDCVARHVGAGIDDEEARAWGWPTDRSYVPETLDQRIVAHADNLTLGSRYGSLADVLDEMRGQGLDEAVLDRVRDLLAGLEHDLGADPDEVADATEPPAAG